MSPKVPILLSIPGNSEAKRNRKRKNKAKRKLKLNAAAALVAAEMEMEMDLNSKSTKKQSNSTGFFHFLTFYAAPDSDPDDPECENEDLEVDCMDTSLDDISFVVNMNSIETENVTGKEQQQQQQQIMSVSDFNEKCLQYLTFRLGSVSASKSSNSHQYDSNHTHTQSQSQSQPQSIPGQVQSQSLNECSVFDEMVLTYVKYMLDMTNDNGSISSTGINSTGTGGSSTGGGGYSDLNTSASTVLPITV